MLNNVHYICNLYVKLDFFLGDNSASLAGRTYYVNIEKQGNRLEIIYKWGESYGSGI